MSYSESVSFTAWFSNMTFFFQNFKITKIHVTLWWPPFVSRQVLFKWPLKSEDPSIVKLENLFTNPTLQPKTFLFVLLFST